MSNKAAGPKPAEVTKLREAHPGVTLHAHRLTLPVGGGSVVVVWREPTHADFEMFTSPGNTSTPTPQWQRYRNLLVSLAVWPTTPTLLAQLGDWPSAIAGFIDDQVLPFFGVGVEVEEIPL